MGALAMYYRDAVPATVVPNTHILVATGGPRIFLFDNEPAIGKGIHETAPWLFVSGDLIGDNLVRAEILDAGGETSILARPSELSLAASWELTSTWVRVKTSIARTPSA